VLSEGAHGHDGAFAGDECGCWDERLHATE
jgi:hypothetical protein